MRVLGERTRAVLEDSKLPTFLWPEVMRSVVFTRNLLPYHGRHIKDPKSPYELRYGRKPDVSFLSVIGSDVYVVLQKEQVRRNPVGRHLSSRTWKGKLVGYNSLHGSGFRIYKPYPNRPKGTLHDVRDVIIDKGSDFSIYHNPNLPPIDTTTPTTTEHATPAPMTTSTTAYEGQGVAQMDAEDDDEGIIIIDDGNDEDEHGTSDSEGSIAPEAESCGLEVEEYDSPSERAPQVLMSTTMTTTSREIRWRIETLALSTQIIQSTPGKAVEGLPELPALPTVGEKWLETPRSLAEAQASPLWPWWWRAMEAEKKQLELLDTWEVVPLTPGTRVLSGKWAFKLKLDADGAPIRFKARWVARGFQQKEGIDYDETFASTGRYETLRVLLAVVTILRMFTVHVDINLAYLNAVLREKLITDYPHCLEHEAPGMGCRLVKSLYGLKQSARNWFDTLGTFLMSKGFRRSKTDPCLYVFRDHQGVAFIFVYVDDMLIAATTADLVERTKRQISSKWSITDLGPVSHYLGMKITHQREAGTLRITQKAYIDRTTAKITTKEGIERRRPATPMIEEPNQASEAFQASRAAVRDYQSAVGSIMYAVNVSRPDAAYSLSVLARFLTNPGEKHHAALQRVNDYMAYTSDYAITYRANEQAHQAFRTGTSTTTPTITSDTGVEDGILRGYVVIRIVPRHPEKPHRVRVLSRRRPCGLVIQTTELHGQILDGSRVYRTL
jgi:hypothetical protein